MPLLLSQGVEGLCLSLLVSCTFYPMPLSYSCHPLPVSSCSDVPSSVRASWSVHHPCSAGGLTTGYRHLRLSGRLLFARLAARVAVGYRAPSCWDATPRLYVAPIAGTA